MEQLIYTSIACANVDGGEIFKIVSGAALKNRELEITGMLVVVDGRFFQAIEGPHDSVNELWKSLQVDRRHHSLRILRRRDIVQRQFTDFSMQRFRVHDIKTARRVFRELMVRNDNAANILREFESYVETGRNIAA